MVARQQFTIEQRNFLALEYHKRKGSNNFKQQLVFDFQAKFPNARTPGKNQIRLIWKKQLENGTVHNLNSKSSPGHGHSGRPRTTRNPVNIAAVKRAMDRDCGKGIGERGTSPVNSARRNTLGISKSSWSRIKTELRYHPYKPVRKHELKPEDLPRRRAFCNWILTLPDQQLLRFLYSDEANFELSGHVNSQNVRHYAPLRSSDRINGGRPDGFQHETTPFSPKLMVYCGIKDGGTFGVSFFENQNMNGDAYHAQLQYRTLPEVRRGNGGNLDGLYWAQDGAPCHVTLQNMRYLDRQFGDRVVSRKSLHGRDWPARSPDFNPLDFFMWGYLKSKVYTPRPATLGELRNNIEREIRLIDPAMLRKVMLDVRTRCRKCIAVNGGHVEN